MFEAKDIIDSLFCSNIANGDIQSFHCLLAHLLILLTLNYSLVVVASKMHSKKTNYFFFGVIPKFPPKWINWLMPLFLSCLMSGSISFANSLIHYGLTEASFERWFRTWPLLWMVGFPLLLMYIPIIRRFVLMFLKTQQSSDEQK